jgi:hypothetical protein
MDKTPKGDLHHGGREGNDFDMEIICERTRRKERRN